LSLGYIPEYTIAVGDSEMKGMQSFGLSCEDAQDQDGLLVANS